MKKNESDELTPVLDGAEVLVKDDETIRTAITDAVRAEDRAYHALIDAKQRAANCESGFILHKCEEDELLNARGDLADAIEAHQTAELTVAGLRDRQVDIEREKTLRNVVSGLEQFKRPLADAALSADTEKLKRAMGMLMQVVMDCRATEAATGVKFVDKAIAVQKPTDGSPVWSLPHGTLPIAVPMAGMASAVNDPVLRRLVTVLNGLSIAIGAAVAERARQLKDAWRQKRALNGGIARTALHPDATPTPPRAIRPVVAGDPDIFGSPAHWKKRNESSPMTMESPND